MGIVVGKEILQLGIAQGGVHDTRPWPQQWQWAPGPTFGNGLPLSQALLNELSNQVLQLLPAQGRLGFQLPKHFVREIEGGSHKDTFT
jgi:hypothetical protein